MQRFTGVLVMACTLGLALQTGTLQGGEKGVDKKGPKIIEKGSEKGGEKGTGKAPTPVVRNWYELRYLPYGDNYVLMRFERFTGRTWVFTALRWQEIEEGASAVPPGHYEIHLIPVARSDSPREYRAFRIEQETGLTWLLTAQKWEEVKDR